MNPGSLQLIGADAGGHGGAGRVEVSIEEAFRKRPHREPRDRHMAKRDGSVPAHARRPNAAHGSCRAAPEAARARRPGPPAWRSAARRAPRSGRSRPRSAVPDIAATVRAFSRASVSATSPGPPVHALLDRALVEMRGPRLDRNAGRFEQRAAHLALRGEDQRLGGKPERHQRMTRKCTAIRGSRSRSS